MSLPSSRDQRGNRFIEHLKPLQGALEGYCRRSVYRSTEVEDILQTAVMKAFRDFDNYIQGTNFRAWIFKYATLEILAGNRNIARHDHEALVVESVEAPNDILQLEMTFPRRLADAPEVILDHCDNELARAVWELQLMERSTLLLHAIGEFKYREIAEILELPVGTVMSHLSRARQKLRIRLAEWSRELNIVPHSETESA